MGCLHYAAGRSACWFQTVLKETPLHVALRLHNIDAIKLLLESSSLDVCCCDTFQRTKVRKGGSKNRNPWNPRSPPKFTKSIVFNRPIVSATWLNQQCLSPTLSDRRIWTVDEIEVASSLNFSIRVECSLLNACECVDFVNSTGFRGSR